MTTFVSEPTYWNQAISELSRNDKTLKKVIDSYKGEVMQLRPQPFYTLARSITGQQISVKAAQSVWNRVMETAGTMTPEIIAHMNAESLKACGLSSRKVEYMHALANHFIANTQIIAQWPSMSDEAIISELCSIKGIGRWTAEMFLIFHLGRPDIFPLADIGLQKAVYKFYNEGKPMPLNELRNHGDKWKPWRSVATWYLWRSLDPVPVAY